MNAVELILKETNALYVECTLNKREKPKVLTDTDMEYIEGSLGINERNKSKDELCKVCKDRLLEKRYMR